MLKDEFKFIGKNRLILLSVLVIMLIPFLYSIFFLKSVWDPYGDTKELPVAVVNNDHAVEYNGRRMNVGKDLVKKLKTNDQLGWKFVTESQAKEGLKDNKYYTVVTIPDNFSSHAATVLNDKPKKMQLTYETNDSLNYLSQVISGIGVDKLASEIRASVTNAYASAMFDQMKVLGSGMSKAATGANQVGDGLVTLDDGLNQYTAGVSQVNDGVQTMAVSVSPLSSGVKKLDDGSSQVASGVKQYTDGTDKVASGLSQLNGQTGELKSGVSQLSTGASQVAGGLSTLNGKTSSLQSGVSQLNTGASQVAAGVTQYTNGTDQVAAGLSTLNGKTSVLQNAVGQLAPGAQQVSSGLSTLNSKTGELQTGVNQLATGAEKLNTALQASADPAQQAQINQLLTGLPRLNNGIQQLNQTLQAQVPSMPAIDTTALNNSIASIDANAANLQSGLGTASAALQTAQTAAANGTSTQAATTSGVNSSALASEISNAIKAKYPNVDASDISAIVEQAVGTTTTTTAPQATNTDLNSALANIQTGLQTARGAATNLNGNLTTVKNALPSATTLEQLSGLSTSLNQLKQQVAALASSSSIALPGAAQAISSLNTGLQQVTTGVGQLSTGLGSLSTQVPGLVSGVSQLNTGASQVADGLGQLNGQVPGLVSGVSQLNTGAQQLTAKSNQLNSGASQVSTGLGQLNGQVPALSSGVSKLSNGASQVSNGLGKLNGQVPALVSGVSQLNNGAQQLTAKSGELNDGATQVSDGLTTLNNKIPALTDGVDKLSAGTSELNDKSGQLKDGSSKLKDGSKQLATSLDSGAKQVNGIKLTKATADMFSAPTKTTHKNYTYVPNYGHALAPYVLSLALYVGALVFNFAYPIRKVSKKDGTATQWFFSKIVLGGLVAVGMAIVEGGLMQVGGLTVAHQGQFFLFAILFALASMYLVMFLSMLLDNPGRFIAMVLLMLQLGGSGGTFPMEITNGFYNAIHPFLPMTYSILGFRNAITSGISGSSIATSIGFLIAVILISLVLLWLSMQFLQRRHLMGVSQLDDNQKLQEVEK